MKKTLGIIALVVVTMGVIVACDRTPSEENNNKTSDNVQISGDINDANNENNVNDGKGENDENDVNGTNGGSEKSGETVLEPINTVFEVEKVFENVKTISGLDDTTRMSDTQIKENYNFGEYEGLQMEIRSKETEDSFTEIAIVKIGENKQSLDLYQIISGRIYDLRQKYAEDEKKLAIINNNDNIVMKQQAGVLIAIIGENAKKIEEEIDKQF